MTKKFYGVCIAVLFIVCGIMLASFVIYAEPTEVATAKELPPNEAISAEDDFLTVSDGIEIFGSEGQIALLNKSGEQDEININKVPLSNFTDVSLIRNSNYFVKNPKHGNNDGSDSLVGTCTTVAMQMLMGYHNYYSDRRIIPEISADGTRFLCENYGNLDSSPWLVKGENDVEDLGIGEIGTEDSVYKELLNLTSSQAIFALKNAANDFLVKHSPEVRDHINIRYKTYSKSLAISEISVGRPTILGFEPAFSPAHNFHVVVAYGYAKYNGTEGFIVHYGYGGDQTQMWIPESYFGYQITMEVNHLHRLTYTADADYPGYMKTTCSECGCVLLERMYKLDDTGTITYVYYPTETVHIIPAEMYGQKVTAIGKDVFKNTGVTGIIIKDGIKTIGDDAFSGCADLVLLTLPSTLEKIGARAFMTTPSLLNAQIPSSVKEIGGAAFAFSGISKLSFGSESQLSIIDASAFSFCEKLTQVRLPASLTTLGDGAFLGATGLESVFIPSSVSAVGGQIFTGCTELTVYTSRTGDDGWHEKWNSQNRPVVWGCTTSEDWVVSFTKTDTNPENVDADTVLNNPTRAGYTFAGWYTTADFSGTQYMDLASAPSGTLYAKWTESACVAAGTLITLADGRQVPVEELTGDEMLLVWNMFTGEFDVAPILFIDSEAAGTYEVITLTFSDGTTLKVIDEHALWDFDLNEYVFMRSDAAKYIGHWFNKQTYDAEGNMIYTRVQLTGVTVTEEYTSAWSPMTYGHLCFYVNGMLSMPGATTGLINIFDVDPDTMTIDEEQYLADIAQYGLFTYKEFAVMYPVPEEIFDAFGGQYLKVAMGKGLLTTEMIEALINSYSEFF